jgi:hypothetical protein
LLGFHLEPGWAVGSEWPQAVAEDVVRRLYPNERPVFIGEPEKANGPAWLCVVYLYSDTPARSDDTANYSSLLACGLVNDVGLDVRSIVCQLLSQVEWNAVAVNDFMW